MVKVDSDGTTRIGLLYPSIPFSLGLVVFLLRIPLACGTGLLTRSQAPEEEGAPLKRFQKWRANGANSQNHSKIWSNTTRVDDVRILSGGHEGICHFIWQELIKVSVPRIMCFIFGTAVLFDNYLVQGVCSMHTNMKSLFITFVSICMHMQ